MQISNVNIKKQDLQMCEFQQQGAHTSFPGQPDLGPLALLADTQVFFISGPPQKEPFVPRDQAKPSLNYIFKSQAEVP
jgi:hypothetical protein